MLARYGPEAYGLISIALSVVIILASISRLGFNAGIERFVSYYSANNDTEKRAATFKLALKISLAISAILSILLIVCANFIANNVFHKPEVEIILQIMALAIPSIVLTELYASAFRGIQKLQYIVLTQNVLDSIFKIATAAIPIAIGFGMIALAGGYVAAVYFTLLTIAFALQKYGFKITGKTGKADESIISYSLPLALASTIVTVVPLLDVFILGIFKTAAEVGIYNVAVPSASLLLIVPTAIFSLFLSLTTDKYAKKDNTAIKEIYTAASKWTFLINLPILLFFVFFAPQFLYNLFGAEYAQASTALAILAAGNFIFSFFWASIFLLQMVEKTKEIMYLSIINLVSSVALNVMLIPLIGINGAAIATAFSMSIYGLLSFGLAQKYVKEMPLDKKTIAFGLASFVFMLIFSLAAQNLHLRLIEIITSYVVISLIYLLLLFKLGILGETEKSFINTLRARLYNK